MRLSCPNLKKKNHPNLVSEIITFFPTSFISIFVDLTRRFKQKDKQPFLNKSMVKVSNFGTFLFPFENM